MQFFFCFFFFFIVYVIHVSILPLEPSYQRRGGGGATRHIFVSVQSHVLDFQRYGLFMFNDLRSEVIVRFVDVGGIVDHH